MSGNLKYAKKFVDDLREHRDACRAQFNAAPGWTSESNYRDLQNNLMIAAAKLAAAEDFLALIRRCGTD